MSRIIRGVGGQRGRVIRGEILDARQEAHRILDEAREEARQIVAEARAERAQARAAGRAEGLEAGRAEVTELLLRAREAAAATHDSTAAEVGSLAVRVAEKLLGRALELAPETAADLAAQALTAARHQRSITLRVHPSDLEAVDAARPRLSQLVARAPALAICADASVGRGGCVVETEVGVIDARLDTQLDAIERVLTGGLER